MKKNLRSVFGLVLMTFFSLSLYAQTVYYVSPTGSDSNPGSESQPYKTLAKAVSVTANNSNTIIYLRGGTYVTTSRITIANTKNGTASTYLRIFAYPGDPRPVLDFSSMATGSSNQGLMLRASYWYLKGFDIYGAGDNGLKIEGGSYNIVENCAFYENDDTGLQIDDGAHHNKIINCDSYFNRDPGDGNADGFACKLLAGTGNSFKGCRAWQNSDDGWDGLLTSPNDDISTTYDSCWCFYNGYLKTGAASVGNGNGFKMGGNQLRHNATLTHCLSVYNRVKGFDQNNDIGDMILYNCTGYGNKPNFGMNNYDPASGKMMLIKNCISYAGKSGDVFRSVAVRTNNSWQSPFVTTADDFISLDTSVLRGPRKADGSLPDINLLHLAAGSDLIDGGVDVGLAYRGTAPDLGAFETSGVLPLSLSSFTAVNNIKAVELTWTMVSVANSIGWTVERSTAGNSDWQPVGFVNSNGQSSYSFVDAGVAPGKYLYRLRQMDADGKLLYSHVLLVIVGKNSQHLELSVYPNPMSNIATVRFNVPVFSTVHISLYNEAGQFVKLISNDMLDAGVYQKLIIANALPAGKYMVKAQVGKEWVTSYVIKL